MLVVGLWRELKVRRKPIHLVFTAIGCAQEVFDDALLHLGSLALVAIGNCGRGDVGEYGLNHVLAA